MDALTTAPAVVAGTLDVLQAYPLGTLTVTTPLGIGLLTGLAIHNIGTSAYVKLPDERVATPISPAICRPHLRPFSALCDPLPDGTVPAVEVAKLLGKVKQGDKISTMEYWSHHPIANAEAVAMQCVGGWAFYLTKGIAGADMAPLCVVDYLRRHHFAVGLEPHQFIPK